MSAELRRVGAFKRSLTALKNRLGALAGLKQSADLDYIRAYAAADLSEDYWTVVGPTTRAEYDELSKIKLDYLAECGLTPNSRLLDVGCGTGQVAQSCETWLSADGTYFGVDIAAECIEYCKRRFTRQNFHFAVNEPTSLAIEGMTFDAACFFSVFTHTYLSETVLLLAETARLLSPDGWVFADVFTSTGIEDSEGGRARMVVNREQFIRLTRLAGFAEAQVVFAQETADQASREFFRLTRG